MSKRHRNAPGPGHFKVQGHPVEDADTTKASKQALVREAARLKRRPKPKRVAAKRARPALAQKVEVAVPAAFEHVHDREFARMNERKAAKRVKPSDAEAHQPRYLTQTARGLLQRAARVALAPLALARAVVDRFRDHD